jgi:DNA-binding MarR family transcriptional regulator
MIAPELTMILAQAQTNAPAALPDPSHWSSIGWILLGAAALATALNQVDGFIKRRTGMEDRRTVSFAAEPASKEEFDRHVDHNSAEHRDIFAKLGGVDRGLSSKMSAEVQAVHVRVNAVEKAIGGLEATTALQNQTLAAISADIKKILSSMPRSAESRM